MQFVRVYVYFTLADAKQFYTRRVHDDNPPAQPGIS